MAITLISNIEPKNAGDFSILEDIYLDGGFRVVADTTERDAITVQRLKTGMLVYVVDITTTYRYTGSGWDTVSYDDDKVKIDSLATAGYIGAASSDGVLRTGSPFSYTDGGDYITLDIAVDGIKDTHIDWGTGANQVSAVDVPITDSGSYYTGEEVETALSEIYPAFASTTVGSAGCSLIGMDVDGSPTYSDLCDWSAISQSAGLISGGAITDATSGNINVAVGCGIAKTADTEISPNVFVDWDARSGITITQNVKTTIYVDYNASPQVNITTNPSADINYTTKFSIGSVLYDGTTMHILNEAGTRVYNLARRTHHRARELRGFEPVTGDFITTDEGTLHIKVTAGIIYAGNNRISLNEFDSTGTAFNTWYYDGDLGTPAWVSGTSQTLDATYYNDIATGLTALGNGKYGVHWIYVDVDSHVNVVYGTTNGNLGQAQASNKPSFVPTVVSDFALWVARVIVKQGTTEIIEIGIWESSRIDTTTATQHDELGTLAWTSCGHTGTVSSFAGFDGSGDSIDYTESNYLLADGSRELTGNWDAGSFRITADDLKANNSLYLGSSEADSGIYFYDGGSETGESIYWDDSEGRFSTSNSFYIYGTLTAHVDVVAGTVRSGGSFYAGNNQVVADTGYHFWNGTNFTKSLLWDYSEAEFIFNDDVNITGGLYVSSVLETDGYALIGTTSLVNDEMLRVYQSEEGGDCIIGGISSAGSNDYFIRLIEGASTNHFYVTKNLSYFSMPVQINGQLDLNGNLDLDAYIRGDYAANILNTSTVADSHGLKVDSTVKNSYGLHVYAEGTEVAKFAAKLTTILNATTLDLGLTVNGTTVLNEGGSSTGDVRWESDLSIYGFVCDASANGGNGGIGIGTSSIPHGGIGYAKLAIEGLDSNAYGPHVQMTTPTDIYPLLQIFNWRHDLISINFDSYYSSGYKSSDAGSNFAITKNGDKLLFRAESGIAAGSAITWKEAFSIASNGTVVFNDGSDSICDLRVETNTKSNALFIDSSNDIIYLNTTGVSSPYYSGSMLEGFEAITGNDLVAFSFNASMSSMDSGHWQAVLGGKGYTTIAAGEAAYGFFGEVVDTGNSTGGSLIGFQGNATVGTSQTGMGIETYHGVVASKAATTLHGLYSHAAYLGESASLGTAYGVYAEREIVATTNYTGWFGGRVKVATEGLIIPVVSTLPSVQLESGYMVIYENGATRRLYMRAGTTWRYVNLT